MEDDLDSTHHTYNGYGFTVEVTDMNEDPPRFESAWMPDWHQPTPGGKNLFGGHAGFADSKEKAKELGIRKAKEEIDKFLSS